MALRQIGTAQAAPIAEEANSVFGAWGPQSDRYLRAEALDRLGESATDALNALDARFYKYPAPSAV
jgi:hypothetical protein